jgi:hypothetical protein
VVRVGVAFGGLVVVTAISHSFLSFVVLCAVDAAPMLRPDHRALHDHVAGTRVLGPSR